MELKLATIEIYKAAHQTARLIEVITVREKREEHRFALQNAETGSKQVKNNATMATKLDALTVR